jgi:hypothetical protein
MNMVLQGLDLMEQRASKLIALCERHKFTEGILDNSTDPRDEANPNASLKDRSSAECCNTYDVTYNK